VEYQSVPFRSHEISDELDTLTNESQSNPMRYVTRGITSSSKKQGIMDR
jgi:hypothetical protein